MFLTWTLQVTGQHHAPAFLPWKASYDAHYIGSFLCRGTGLDLAVTSRIPVVQQVSVTT
jgi:hypothetical protein